uniref:Mediator complex subunit 16 C-terminal domain-containing protein n=1 Tax=Junco hyemalis TaxID=40217 RepID=A0A8C5NKW4_JUNHY
MKASLCKLSSSTIARVCDYHAKRLHLGAYPTEECKSCTRCGCVTMLKSPNKVTAVKQWEQRWIKNCLCGGLWRKMPLSYS